MKKFRSMYIFVIFLITIINCEIFSTDGYTFRQRINITADSNLENEDVLIQLNTVEMVKKDYILPDCSDIIFILEKTGERLDHYIENSCNETVTRFYITHPNITTTNATNSTDNSVMMYFRLFEPESLAEEFEGYFYEFKDAPCDGNWRRESNFDGNFPFISSSNPGETSPGSLEHSHFVVLFTGEAKWEGDAKDGYFLDNSYNSRYYYSSSDIFSINEVEHEHLMFTDSGIKTQNDVMPSYKEHYVCRNDKSDYRKDSIAIFADHSSFSSNSTIYSKYNGLEKSGDNYLILGGVNGAVGGSDFHKHDIQKDTIQSVDIRSFTSINNLYYRGGGYNWNYNPVDSTGTTNAEDHVHSIFGETDQISNFPQNRVDFVFGKKNSDDSIEFNQDNLDNMFYLVNSLPPKGFIVNDTFDGKFLSSGDYLNDYGVAGSNSISHLHNIELSSGNAIGDTKTLRHIEIFFTNTYTCYYSVNPCFNPSSDISLRNQFYENHYHESKQTNTASKTLQYPTFNVMLVQRKSINTQLSFGEVEQVGTLFERGEWIVPSNCDPECLNGGVCIENATDTDVWVCNCSANFKGDICQTLIIPEIEPGEEYDPTILIAITASSVGAVLVVVVVLIIVIVAITLFMLKRRKDQRLSSKMIDQLVKSSEKDTELQEQREMLEEERIKFENDKKQMEDEREQEKAEKEELKKALEKLKQEKLQLERQSFSALPGSTQNIEIIKKTDITDLKKLENMKDGYETFKGKYKGEMVMYRLFSSDVFKVSKFRINPINLLKIEIQEYLAYQHPNIIRFIPAMTNTLPLNSDVGVLTEFPINGSLVRYFSKKKRSITFLQKVRIFYELANAIQFLHKRGKCVGDLKSENVFLTKGLRPKIDFGFNKTFDKELIYSEYAAPELIKPQTFEEVDEDDEPEDSPHLKCDVYAFGMLMFEVVSQNFNLYRVDRSKKVKIGEKAAEDPDYRPKLKAKYYPNWFVNLIKMCWQEDASARPSISRIKMIIETIAFEDKDD